MAVTKRTRFEVLRRDAHTCVYCGATAPETSLHIDHVVPVSLGGANNPSNLVTACKDCNAGKSSIAPDSPLVKGLGEQAVAYALGMQDKMTRFRQDVQSFDDYLYTFNEIWDTWGHGDGDAREPIEKPGDYRTSLFRWHLMGIPSAVFDLAIPPAMVRNQIRDRDKFTYMAGVVWKMVNQREIDYSVTEDSAAVYTAAEAEERSISEWCRAYDSGVRRSEQAQRDTDVLAHHIDGTLAVA